MSKKSFLVCDFIASDNPGPLLVIHWPDSNYTVILRIKLISVEMLVTGRVLSVVQWQYYTQLCLPLPFKG